MKLNIIHLKSVSSGNKTLITTVLMHLMVMRSHGSTFSGRKSIMLKIFYEMEQSEKIKK